MILSFVILFILFSIGKTRRIYGIFVENFGRIFKSRLIRRKENQSIKKVWRRMDFLKYYLKNGSRLLFALSKNWLKVLWESFHQRAGGNIFSSREGKEFARLRFSYFSLVFQIYSSQCTCSDSKFLDLYTSTYQPYFLFLSPSF